MSNRNEMKRGDFIKGLLTTGGLVAASRLPVLGADDPSLFSGRGRYERLSLSYQHVHIGLEKPFSVLHISDTHLTEAHESEPAFLPFARNRRKTFGGRQLEALRDSLAWAKDNADFLLHTGDLIDFQSQANLDLVRKYWGPGQLGCTGNHEYVRKPWEREVRPTAEFNALSASRLQEAYPFDVLFQSTVVNGVNFICLDQTYGTVTEAQVERFNKEVAKGLPIVLCLHVPLMTESIRRASDRLWQQNGKRFANDPLSANGDARRQTEDKTTAAFVAALKREPLLKAILAGHLHLNVQDQFSPTAREYVVGGNFLFLGQEILFT